LLVVILSAACGSGDGGSDCELPEEWSTAVSGGLCQVNFYTEPEQAVYCARNADDEFSCACGPAAEDPEEFVSADFCELDGEARACAAIEICGFSL
jgi:hypothetical protein